MDAVRIDELDTPCLTVGLDVFESNLRLCMNRLVGVRVRPHIAYRPALAAIATVISRPTPDRAVVDAGLKTLSNDSGPARLADTAGWTYQPAGDEHGTLTPTGGSQRRVLRVGDKVALLPSHIDTTVNLHDALHTHRKGQIETIWAIAARGKVQ